MKISDIISGTIDFDDISPLLSTPLLEDCTTENLDLLKEDLLQASYSAELLLDVGWYSRSGSSGVFQIVVIQSHDWERPVFKATSTSIEDMVDQIKIAETYILEKYSIVSQHKYKCQAIPEAYKYPSPPQKL